MAFIWIVDGLNGLQDGCRLSTDSLGAPHFGKQTFDRTIWGAYLVASIPLCEKIAGQLRIRRKFNGGNNELKRYFHIRSKSTRKVTIG